MEQAKAKSEQAPPETGGQLNDIILTGLPGSGKSSLGRLAAEVLDRPFLDLDEEISRISGLSIAEIFSRFGESRFRTLEKECIARLGPGGGRIIAAGGGAIIDPQNEAALKKNGLIIFIDRPPEKILETLADDGSRPLLKAPQSLYSLAERRRERYLSSADLRLANERTLAEALSNLKALIAAETVDRGYGVIGHPIGHSLSPTIHQAVFQHLGLGHQYQSLNVPPERLKAFVARAAQSGLRGFNVTIPHKKSIMALLDEIDPEAQACGAVNTVVKVGGRLKGYNTDMEGLSLSLREQGRDFQAARLLILGAGGAAGAVAFKALRQGAAQVRILARDPQKAHRCAQSASKGWNAAAEGAALSPQELKRAAADADLLINCTPLGMEGFGQDFECLDFLDQLPSEALVCDLIYKPQETSLLRRAAARGLKTLNGLGMLIQQAVLADELFLNIQTKRAELCKAAAAALSCAQNNPC